MSLKRTKAEDWLSEEALDVLAGWARAGLTYKEIASNIGVTRASLHLWREKYPEIREALAKNKEFANRIVENALYKSACGFMYQEQIATNKGDIVWVTRYEKPNITAQIFYLKNRLPQEWRDRKEVKHEAKVTQEYVAEWGTGNETKD